MYVVVLGCYDKLGINFHIIDKNGEFHTFESRIDLGDLDTISKTPMLDVLKSMEKWTSVKLEGLSDDVHAMVEELEDRLKRNELPSLLFKLILKFIQKITGTL